MKFSRDTWLTIIGVILVAVFGVAAFWAIDRYTSNLAGTQQASAAGPTTGQGGFNRANFTPPANFTPGAGFGGGANFTPPADFTPGAGFTRRATRTETPAAPAVTDTPANTDAPSPTTTLPPTLTPQPSPTSGQTFKLNSLTSPVTGGDYAAAIVVTSPGFNCTLIYKDPSGKISNPAGTGTVQADQNGICKWSWQIKPLTQQGTGTVTITVNQYSLSYPIVIK